MKNNLIFKAMLGTILIFASAHLILLYTYALYTKDFERVNAFRILDLNLIFPNISKGGMSFFISQLLPVFVFFIVYFFLGSKRK